ncbi:MAG: hypothetical protein AAFZ52_11185 [Bacteroidota bacterium]
MYPNIPRNSFQEGGNGPAIYNANIIVGLEAAIQTYQLKERTRLERNHAVGLWVPEPATLVLPGRTQLAEALFKTATLTLQIDQTEVREKIYFWHVLLANRNGLPYELSLPGVINLSESEINVMDNANIPADTVLEFQVDFVKKPRR